MSDAWLGHDFRAELHARFKAARARMGCDDRARLAAARRLDLRAHINAGNANCAELREPLAAVERTPVVEILEAVADAYGLTRADLIGPIRARPFSEARQVAMLLSHEVLGLSFGEVAEHFRRDESTVFYGLRKIREASAPALLARIAKLRATLHGLAGA